jgi:hypothetical protein
MSEEDTFDIKILGGPLDGTIISSPILIEKILIIEANDRRLRYEYSEDIDGFAIFRLTNQDADYDDEVSKSK